MLQKMHDAGLEPVTDPLLSMALREKKQKVRETPKYYVLLLSYSMNTQPTTLGILLDNHDDPGHAPFGRDWAR